MNLALRGTSILLMTPHALAAALAALLFLAPAAAQDSRSVQQLIEDLESDEVEVRDRAEAALRKAGREALPAVEKALQSTRSAEARARLLDIVGYLKVPHAGGTIVDGLRFQLVAGKKEARPGEGIPFKVIVWNVTARPRNLYVGYSTGGVDFQSGNAFEILAPKGESSAKPHWTVGFCGTGAGPIFTTVPGYGSQTFETAATFTAASTPKIAGPGRQPISTLPRYTFPSQYLAIEAPEGDLHRFRVRHEVKREWQRAGGGRAPFQAGKEPFDPAADPWSGIAWSNEIEVKILPAKE